MRLFFPWCPGKIELEAAFPKSTLNFHGINSWTILSLASHPIRNCWENLLSRRWNLRGVYGRFFVRLVDFSSFIWCCWFFLFAVKLWGAYCRKEKANLAQFRQVQITFISLFADSIPGLLNFFIAYSPNTLKCYNRTRFLNCCYYVTLHFISYNFAV